MGTNSNGIIIFHDNQFIMFRFILLIPLVMHKSVQSAQVGKVPRLEKSEGPFNQLIIRALRLIQPHQVPADRTSRYSY